MNKSPSIFQEIERKLAKDHYASRLPAYHPAKGKRTLKEPKAVYQTQSGLNSKLMGRDDGINFNGNHPDEPLPESPPEIGQPGKTEFPEPGEREIDPGRDFPPPNIPRPHEEEIPGEEPDPEVDPDRLANRK